MLIPSSPERYLRCPVLCRPSAPLSDDDGARAAATLSVIAWEGERERILRFDLDPDGAVLDEHAVTPPSVGLLGLRPDDGGPVLFAEDELRARSRDARAEAWISHEEGVVSVWVERRPQRTLAFRAVGMACAPALVTTDDGTWLAFHHDVREDTHERDIAKWIALRFVSTRGEVFEPAAPMVDLDRDRAGEEQSFEFPALVRGADGALALFGRGSHNFWRQDLNARGFSPRVPLSDGAWGSRGRRPSAIALADGALLVARRERHGIEIGRLDPVTGGPPALRPAQVDCRPARARDHVGTAGRAPTKPADRVDAFSRVDRARDPARAHGLQTFFGDIQQHSAHSDGVGSAHEAYLRARDRYGDDFVALTDHESFLGKRTGPGEWRYLQDVAHMYDAPGRFATLVAYEWTGKRFPGPGHKCVYLPREGMPIVSRDVLPEGRDLVEAIREAGGIASPHHIGWTGCDEGGHEPIGQPVWEICSCHGCYEHAEHPLGYRGEHHDQLAQPMLRKGHRFGFTASSDAHGLLWHHGTSRKRDPYRTGLTAVQAPRLTRGAVFEALRERRCYATSGAKILLDMCVDGAPMGSELKVDGPSHVTARAVGAGALEAIELITERGVEARVECEGDEGAIDASIDAAWVYARVIQRDGEMAWASPVFFDRA